MCAFLGGKRAGRQAGLGRGYVNISVVSQNWGICLYVCVCGVPGVVCKLFFFFFFFFFYSAYTFLFCLNVFMDVDS